jgi:ribose 5-phosphate isomerase B
MKNLITEKTILAFYKSGKLSITLSKDDIITPLAKDKIKELKISVNISSDEAIEKTDIINSNVIFIGSDHTGFELKQTIKKFLETKNKIVEDLGTFDNKSCDYPDFAIAVAKKVKSRKDSFGILIDATGIPSAITANKIKGIRAATCYNEFSAWSARNHNNANVLVLGAKTLGEETVKSIITKWLETNYEGGRHQKRLDKITAIENENL